MGEKAVSEIIGAIVLLAMAVAVFSVIYMNVLADDGPAPDAFLTVIGKIDENFNVTFDHSLGEEILLNSPIDITVGGHPLKDFVDFPCEKVSDLISTNIVDIDKWNIGEQLLCPLNEKFADYEIKANIFDIDTNSMVFWGTLQEGKMFTGFGGIWHFNETSWDKDLNTYEVKDSSGNGNHGTAFNDADTHENVSSAEAKRSGYFNFTDGTNDYVFVRDDLSLDIKNQITMEAWIKPFNFSATGTAHLENKFGFTPYITHVYNNTYAVASEDVGGVAPGQYGILQTFNITPIGGTSNNYIDKFDYFGDAKSTMNLRPIMTRVSNEIFVIAFNNESNKKNITLNVDLKTLYIYNNGSISDIIIDELPFDDYESKVDKPYRPSIIKVFDSEKYSIFAITYAVEIGKPAETVCILRTINISSNGIINKNTIDIEKFNDTSGCGYYPSIINAAPNLYAISYRGSNNLGFIKTFYIYEDGSIEYTEKPEFIFDNIGTSEDINFPNIIKISNFNDYSIFAIVYGFKLSTSDPPIGRIKTIKIYHNGTILNNTVIDNNKTFESSSCYDPYIFCHSENHYIIVYYTKPSGNSHGKYVTIEIANNGSITAVGKNVVFDEYACYNPMGINISDYIFAIVYEGTPVNDPEAKGGNKSGHPGKLETFIVEYPSYVFKKGIYKYGSYGINANSTTVTANINANKIDDINKKTISAPIITDIWTHVALTYDGNYIKLYVNGDLANSSKPLGESIRITNKPLIFGDSFYGLIDEIAIYPKVLDQSTIQQHMNSPNTLENVIMEI